MNLADAVNGALNEMHKIRKQHANNPLNLLGKEVVVKDKKMEVIKDFCYQITYTSMLDGCRHTYMNVGFECKDRAQNELKLLMKAAKKFKKDYPDWDHQKESQYDLLYVSAAQIGKYWRIKKVSIKKNN